MRVHHYVYAYQKLQQTQDVCDPGSLGYHEVMSEPLFLYCTTGR